MRVPLLLIAWLSFALCQPAEVKAPNTCNPGYTGSNCDNPICSTPGIIETHDGTSGTGDMISWQYSFTCNEEFAFYIDEFVTSIALNGYAQGRQFSGSVYKGGDYIPPTRFSTGLQGWHIAYYDDIAQIHGYGQYRLIVTATDPGSCELYITAPTPLTIDGGFITNRTDPNVQEVVPEPHQGVGLNPQINTDEYFAFQIGKALQRPGKATDVTTYLVEGYSQTNAVKDRYNCAATQYAGPFHCDFTAGAYYHVKVKGVDSKGNVWQRVYPFLCETSTTAVPPTSGPPPTECHHGGILVNAGTPQAECYCGQYYEGRQCDIIRCFNGGRVNNGKCLCNVGYSGTYCQDVVCYDQSTDNYDLSERAVIFIVRTGQSMIGHIQQITEAADRINNYYARTDPTYIQQWMLVTVTNGVVVMNNYGTPQTFINAIRGIPNTVDTICNDKLYNGLSAVLASSFIEVYKRSPIFIFTDGLPDDDMETRFSLLHQFSFFRGQLYFMLADSSLQRCTIDTASEAFIGLRYLTQFTHGHVSYVKLSELALTTYSLATTLHKAVYIMSNDLLDSCKRVPTYQSFFIDKTTQYFFISATGRGLDLRLTYPNRTDFTPPVYFTSSDNTYIWQVAQGPAGGYLLQLTSTSPDPCSIRVYSNSDLALWLGIASNVNEDVQLVQPTQNTQAHIVSFIDGAQMPLDSMEIHAEATIWTNQGQSDTRTVMYASNGIYRDQCKFNMYFGAWKCIIPFQFFYVNIYMTDRAGTVVQRSFTGYCSTTRTTAVPPDGCMNGGMASGANGTCLCPAHYTGDKCQTIQCLNLGTPVGGTCVCVTGFTGQYCEITSCYTKNKNVNFSPNSRSLTLVIQDSISTRTSIRNIKNQVSALVQDLTHQHKQWISNYQVWRFNDTTFNNIADTADPNEFMSGVTSLYNSNTAASDPSCRDLYVLPGMLTLLMHPGLTTGGLIYFFINGYMKVDTQQLNQVEAVYEMLELTQVQLNVVLMSGSPCGQELNQMQSTILMNFVGFTGGQFAMVMPAKAGSVIRAVPTQYRSNFIYENYVDQCTAPTSFYFPVDSQMQGFTAYIVGEIDESSLVYSQPDGTRKYPYNLWQDYGMGSRLDQITKECDNNWDLMGNRCWLLILDPMTWTAARDLCHKNGAILMTINNVDEQKFIDSKFNGVQYWIGLNDLANVGVWMWDDLYGNPVALGSTGYQNWAPGQPVTNDVNRCVYDNAGAGWASDSCNTQRVTVCVKHAYDADYEPEASNVGDLLSRGIWKMSLQTTSGPCYVQIIAQSGIQLYTQFNTDTHADDGIAQPLVNADDNRMLAHVTNQISTGTGNSGQLQYAHYYQNNLTIIEAETFQLRSTAQCSYEYLSTAFHCPSQSFLALTTGVDRFGYLYQRIQPVNCFKGPSQGECVHGVYTSGHCVCDPYYTGSLCTEPICQYGMLDSTKQHCTCFTGYMGATCTIPVCNRQSEPNEYDPTPVNRTFVLLLDGSKDGNMAILAAELKNVLDAVFQKLSNYNGWFTHYTGIVFRDSSVGDASLSDIIEASDTTDFTTRMIAEYNKAYTPTSTNRSIMAAVNKAMGSPYIMPRSYVWIVTANIPEDGDREPVALTAAAREHCYVNFMIIGDDAAPGGAKYNDSSLNSCYDLIMQTGGQFYQIPAEAGKLAPFWTGLFSNYYNAYYVSTRTLMDCSHGLIEYIQIGTNTSTIILDSVGAGLINLTDPTGNQVTLYVAAQSRTNAVRVAQNYGTFPGLWKVRIPSYKGFCSVSIRGQSLLDVYIAFTHDTGSDGGYHSNDADAYPITGDGANAVVVYSSFGVLNFAQIYSVDERDLLWSSPLLSRSRCTYPYVSRNTFTCPALALAVAIEGEDDFGYPFRRMVHVHCNGAIRKTTTIPMNATTGALITTTPYPTISVPPCDTSAKFDIYLMFDASLGVKKYEFEAMTMLMDFIPNELVIGQNSVRFIIGAYDDSAYFVTRNFGIITNGDEFRGYLDAARLTAYKGDMGNNIQSLFDIMDPLSWRSDAQVTLIFFSSMGWDKSNSGAPYTDPAPAAQGLRRQGGKVIPIGYGPNANKTQLQAIGLGCTKIADGLAALENQVLPWLTAAICSKNQLCAW